jgi:hypothetical protein
MSKEDDYRKNAEATVELANKASTAEDRLRLLALAEKWLDLADRIHRTIRTQASNLHPLVRAKLPDLNKHEGG